MLQMSRGQNVMNVINVKYNKPEDIIVYWDEPTITMDYETHEYHSVIHKDSYHPCS